MLNMTAALGGFDVVCVTMNCKLPKGAFYVFANVKPILKRLGVTSAQFADILLYSAHVVVLPGSAFGNEGEGYIRLSFCVSRLLIIAFSICSLS